MVPPEVTAEISKHNSLFLVSMGGGHGGDCQYLFACDVQAESYPSQPFVVSAPKSEMDAFRKMMTGK